MLVMLLKFFEIDDAGITNMKKARIDAQYNFDSKLSISKAESMLEEADRFNSQMYDLMQRMTDLDVGKYQDMFNLQQ